MSKKDIRIHLPKILNKHYHILPLLFVELRNRRPKIRAAVTHNPRRVRFKNDQAELMIKPDADTIATYQIDSLPSSLTVKTREEINEESLNILLSLKKINSFKPNKLVRMENEWYMI